MNIYTPQKTIWWIPCSCHNLRLVMVETVRPPLKIWCTFSGPIQELYRSDISHHGQRRYTGLYGHWTDNDSMPYDKNIKTSSGMYDKNVNTIDGTYDQNTKISDGTHDKNIKTSDGMYDKTSTRVMWRTWQKHQHQWRDLRQKHQH